MVLMEIDKQKTHITKAFLGAQSFVLNAVISKREDWNVEKIVREKLKGSLD